MSPFRFLRPRPALAATALILVAAVSLTTFLPSPAAAQEPEPVDTPTQGICDRTAKVQALLINEIAREIARDGHTRTCEEVTAEDLASITTIFDPFTYLTTLQPGDLDGLTQLQSLRLYLGGEITELPAGLFAETPNLKILSLPRQKIGELPAGIFDDVPKLGVLNLYASELTSLPEEVFEHTPNLRILELADNKLAAVSKDTLDDVPELEILNLHHNRLTELPDNLFDNHTELRKLDLSFNRIAALHEDTFDGLSQLTNLNLSGNKLPTLPEDVFEGLSNLTILELQDNPFTSVPVDVFEGLTSLTSLWTNLPNVSPEYFEHVPQLTELFVIAGSQSIPEDSFHKLTDLERLTLGYGDITSLPADAFDGLSELKWLDLAGNKLTSLDEDIFDGLTNLESLRLLGNELTSLDEDIFEGLTSLETLYLGSNQESTQLSTLPANLFADLAKLKTLIISDAGLDTLPEGAFNGLEAVERIDLTLNNLRSLPAGLFEGITKLNNLGLRQTQISTPVDPPAWAVELGLDPDMFRIRTGDETLVFQVHPELVQGNRIVAKVIEGAPFDISVMLSAEGGTLSANKVTIPAGSIKSPFVTVTPLSADRGMVTVKVTYAIFEGWDTFDDPAGACDCWGFRTGPGDPITVDATFATITGEPRVGETLTADKSYIQDPDGMENAVFSYQWLADDADIEDATDSTYDVSEEDVGKGMKVKVSFTDDADNQETLTSGATATVAPRSDNTVKDEEAPVWSADMLVVEYTSVSIGAASADLFSNEGGSAGLQVKSLWSYKPDRDLRLEFKEGVPGTADLTLQVGDLRLAFLAGSSGDNTFKWNDVDVDWEDGQTLAVRIVPTSATAAPQPNNPATGAPTIGGTAQAGETLTANTSGIADTDGLYNAVLSYQWLANDADIQGATNSRYTLSDDDVGKAIKVRVSFTDDANNEETLTSAPTAAVEARLNTPATGLPAINGTVQVGETLTVDTSAIADADGLDDATFTYQWLADDANIQGATDSTYTLADSDEGKAIQVKVSFADDAGNEETLTSAATSLVGAESDIEPNVGYVTVVVQENNSDPDAPATDFTVTWNDPEECSDGYSAYISGWVGSVLDLGSTDSDGTQIAKTVPQSDLEGGMGYGVEVYCGVRDPNWYIVPARVPEYGPSHFPVPGTYSSEPGLTGLTVTEGSLAPSFHQYRFLHTLEDVPSDAKRITLNATVKAGHSVVFLDHNVTVMGSCNGSECGFTYEEAGSDNKVEPLKDADEDLDGFQMDLADDQTHFSIHVPTVLGIGRVYRFSLSRLIPEPPTEPGGQDGNTQATGLPAISGTAQVGQSLVADTSGIDDADGLTNVSYSYQWIRSDGNTDTDIAGATGSTYTLVSADQGKAIKVKVSFTDDADHDETLTSTATGAVTAAANNPATGQPTISGTAQVGEMLTADESGIADADGLNDVTFSYQWTANDGSADTDIQDATDSTYILTDDDAGRAIKVRVSFTDDAGNQETLTSAATDTVAAAATATVPGEPEHLKVSPHDEDALDLYWETPASNGGSPVTGYKVQWKEAADSWDTPEEVSEETVTGTTYTINGLTEGVEYAVRVMASNEVGEGPASAEKTGIPRETRAPEMVMLRVDGATLKVSYDEALDENSTSPADAFDVRVACRCDDTTWHDEEARRAVDAVSVKGETVVLTLASAATAEDSVVVRYTPPSDEAAPRVQDAAGNAAAGFGATQAFNDTEEVSGDEPPAQNSPATGEPTISGTAQVGEMLTADESGIADADGLNDVTFSYQWTANDGSADTDIQDATDSTYILTDDDAGRAIKVRVSFTDDAGNQETLTSAATDTVAAAATATVPGEPEHLKVSPHDEDALDLYWETPASNGGSPVTGYKVQWKEAADSWDTPEEVSEETVTGTTYTINGLTEGVEYAVRVMASNEVGEGPASAEKTGIPRETRAPEMVMLRVDGATLKVSYDEALDENSTSPADAFDVRVACRCDDTTWHDEEAKRAVDAVSVKGDTVVLTLASAATAEDNVVIRYTPPSDEASPRVRDVVGNAAAGFGATKVFNDTEEAAEPDTPLTASLENTPGSHDGEASFTFELWFSEEVKLSYKTLRDHAFTVVGGTVEKAKRLEKGSNIGWRITVQPDDSAEVAITLPATEDCGDTGAICTEDGRKLSNRLELTVSGPGQ